VTGAAVGADGRRKCGWAVSSVEYERYHDEEWGRPVTGEAALFERLSLEGFQSGLSWITILRKRQAFREAFAGFDPHAVAAFTDDDVARLMTDTGIVRNRAKILATIGNAQVVAGFGSGLSLGGLLEDHRPRPGPAPADLEDVPAVTPESTALAKRLRSLGFRFVGPTTCYAMMQATGYVNDHLAGCWARPEAAGTAFPSGS
jgi:DNA-3-methyladenine glycosylase I